MRVIDADGHVEENLDTFSDKYLDPAFRALRPRVTGVDGLAYWVIEEQLYPRRVGPGCHNLGTPTNVNGQVAAHTMGKQESIASMELDDIAARLKVDGRRRHRRAGHLHDAVPRLPADEECAVGNRAHLFLQSLDGPTPGRPSAHQVVGGGQSRRHLRGGQTSSRSKKTRRRLGHGARHRRRRHARPPAPRSVLRRALRRKSRLRRPCRLVLPVNK